MTFSDNPTGGWLAHLHTYVTMLAAEWQQGHCARAYQLKHPIALSARLPSRINFSIILRRSPRSILFVVRAKVKWWNLSSQCIMPTSRENHFSDDHVRAILLVPCATTPVRACVAGSAAQRNRGPLKTTHSSECWPRWRGRSALSGQSSKI